MRQMPFSSNNHAAYGQFSKGYQKISQGVGAHDPRHFDTSRSYQKVPVCARELFLCVQKRCVACGIHKVEKCFHRSSTCWECRSRRSTSTTNITVPIDPSSFAQYFNHEPSHGSRLSLVQRSSLLTLHALGFNDERVAQLTGCDRRTVRHWVTHYQQHHSLEDEPRSGRPRVTSAATDTSIVVAATENPFTTPQNILAEQSIEASSRTVRRRLDAAGLFGRVARIEYPSLRSTSLNVWSLLESTKTGLTTNGRAFYSAMRPTSVLAPTVKYGFSVRKMQHFSMSIWYKNHQVAARYQFGRAFLP